ncbi:DUF2975 domain-containing protein [Salidesulfovibrio onnuriiensis]|uniref:DUF2975 domain-containing protein n=1 Tax=Salidesulfovibrio onnuriiensis TaxID=2583823 RepID=UPI0011C736C3|nr:DUF2975 domain-containing protein [Salidesulfovibrio onnuriiensis]
MDKITKPSKYFALLFKVLFYLYPIAMFIFWLDCDVTNTGELILDYDTESTPGMGDLADPEMWQRLCSFIAYMIPGAALMYIYHSLKKLFSLYSQGIIFEHENVKCFRGVAWGLIASNLLAIPAGTLISFIITVTNPEGDRLLHMGIDDTDISMVVVGIMLLVISRIMDEGRKMKEEQAFTV